MTSDERYPGAIRDWANDLREDSLAADSFAGMAADGGEERAAAWLRGMSEGLRLAAARTYNLADRLSEQNVIDEREARLARIAEVYPEAAAEARGLDDAS